jgi:hypothetical protein
MTDEFVATFKQPEAAPARGKYLSRVFGIFSEEIVRIWARDSRAPFEDLGRPTLLCPDGKRYTLDFTFRNRANGAVFVAEMKCEIEYQSYKYLILTGPSQLEHHHKPAFAALLAVAGAGRGQRAQVGKVELQVDGAILIWGATTPEGRAAVIQKHSFADVLSLAEVVADLRAWRSAAYRELIESRRAWTNQLYDALLNGSATDV